MYTTGTLHSGFMIRRNSMKRKNIIGLNCAKRKYYTPAEYLQNNLPYSFLKNI